MKTIMFFLLLSAVPAVAADITGVWNVDGSVEDHPVTPVCTLKQAGTKLSGSCKFDEDHASDVTGEVKAKEVSWKFTVEYQGTQYTLTFTGTLDTDNAIKGSISVDPSGSDGDFTAKKQ